jgi:hypothetical protein
MLMKGNRSMGEEGEEKPDGLVTTGSVYCNVGALPLDLYVVSLLGERRRPTR